MPPKKRRSNPGDIAHHGRVTGRHSQMDLPIAPPRPPLSGARRTRAEHPPPTPPQSARYTPPIRHVRFRPGWHKAIGAALLVVSVLVVLLNEAMLGGVEHLLPGGHNPLYLIGGVLVAGYSTWWFGWFDRET